MRALAALLIAADAFGTATAMMSYQLLHVSVVEVVLCSDLPTACTTGLNVRFGEAAGVVFEMELQCRGEERDLRLRLEGGSASWRVLHLHLHFRYHFELLRTDQAGAYCRLFELVKILHMGSAS